MRSATSAQESSQRMPRRQPPRQYQISRNRHGDSDCYVDGSVQAFIEGEIASESKVDELSHNRALQCKGRGEEYAREHPASPGSRAYRVAEGDRPSVLVRNNSVQHSKPKRT